MSYLSVFKVILAAISYVGGAYIAFDIGPVPITGQTVVILGWAFFLNTKEALSSIALYLLAGGLGAPVFADGNFGWDRLLQSASTGYFVGFIVASVLISTTNDRATRNVFTIVSGHFVGTLIIMSCGWVGLVLVYDIDDATAFGINNLWMAALVKIAIGTAGVFIIELALKELRLGESIQE